MPWWLAVCLAIVLTTVFGVGLERAAYRPLRDSPRISIMISAIGASFLIENLAIVLFDARPKAFPVPALFAANHVIGGVHVAAVSLIIPVVTAVLLAILLWIVHRTKTGMAMRAVSTDIEAARLMTYNAAERFDAGEDAGAHANMAKLLGSQAAVAAVEAALQTHGGYGFDRDYDIVTLWPMVRLLEIAPINNEMLLTEPDLCVEQVRFLPVPAEWSRAYETTTQRFVLPMRGPALDPSKVS